MEKTKKLSKSSIAVIVLAILLALSMIMGITGAWFTDSAAGGQTAINFGTIQITAVPNSENTSNGAATVKRANGQKATAENGGAQLMPGDTVSFDGTIANNGQKSYIMADVTFVVKDTEDTVVTLADGDEAKLSIAKLTVADQTVNDIKASDAQDAAVVGYYFVANENLAAKAYQAVVTAQSSLTNKYQGYKIEISVNFYAIQFANYGTTNADILAAFNAAKAEGVAGWGRAVGTVWVGTNA